VVINKTAIQHSICKSAAEICAEILKFLFTSAFASILYFLKESANLQFHITFYLI
jgi:hypothetical protein